MKVILSVPDEGYYVPDEGYSRNESCALNLISTFFLETVSKIKYILFFPSFQIFSLATVGVLAVDTFFQFRKFREGQSRPAGSSTGGGTTTTHTTYETRTQY
jgi:hypothetical protein